MDLEAGLSHGQGPAQLDDVELPVVIIAVPDHLDPAERVGHRHTVLVHRDVVDVDGDVVAGLRHTQADLLPAGDGEVVGDDEGSQVQRVGGGEEVGGEADVGVALVVDDLDTDREPVNLV